MLNNIGQVWKEDKEIFLTLFLGEDKNPDPTLAKFGFKMQKVLLLTEWKEEYLDKFWVLKFSINQELWYADCSKVISTNDVAKGELITTIAIDVLNDIEMTIERLLAYQKNLFEGNKQLKNILDKYDYDISISFAGEDRLVAESIATKLHKKGIKVFYDDFERAKLWGKDLVQHLDEVYRKKAKYCILIISKNYEQKIWTNHELKSALARSIQQQEEYILPVLLDNTEISGIRPTTGYVRFQNEKDADMIVDLVIKKMNDIYNPIDRSKFSPKWLENILNINKLWDIDCLAFCIDPRYLEIDGDQSRLGISYGINYTEIRQGFLAPSSQKGKTVFGIHNVVIQNGYELNLVDMWTDSIVSDDFNSIQLAIERAYQLLSDINTERYSKLVDFYGTKGDFGVSKKYLLDEFDICTNIG